MYLCIYFFLLVIYFCLYFFLSFFLSSFFLSFFLSLPCLSFPFLSFLHSTSSRTPGSLRPKDVGGEARLILQLPQGAVIDHLIPELTEDCHAV